MFLRHGMDYIGFDQDTSNQQATLPAGVYKTGESRLGPVFRPAELRTERYVPVETPQSRAIWREVKAFFDPEISERLRLAGVPQRRGIILHGPPGTGKTSLITSMIPWMIERNAVVLLDANGDHLEHILIPAIRRADPGRRVIIFWDEFERNATYSKSELLRLLDGAGSCNNLMVIGATNHLDKIPQALRQRPSRFSLVIEMGNPTREARRAFLMGQFGEVLTADELATVLDLTQHLSMDHSKEAAILLLQGYDPEDIRLRLNAVGGLFNMAADSTPPAAPPSFTLRIDDDESEEDEEDDNDDEGI